MASEAQITANRLNSQKSTGPRTPEGKSIASQNSTTHGLSSQQDIISNEDPAEYNLHRDQLLAELNPASPMESILAARIVSLSWRLKRAVSIQNQAINVLLNPPPPNPLAELSRSLISRITGQSKNEPASSCVVAGESVAGAVEKDKGPATTSPEGPKSQIRNPTSEITNPFPLGRAFIKDLSNSKVLDRLLMYERRIEHSLFKTITELHRLTLIRKMNPIDSDRPVSPQVYPGGLPPKTENPNHSRRETSPERRPTIMQNEPNFAKANLALTPCPETTYTKNTLSAKSKSKANFTITSKSSRNPEPRRFANPRSSGIMNPVQL